MFLIFYELKSMSTVLDRDIPLFFCFIIAYLIPASHYINQQTVAAFDSLKPNLDLGESELAEIRDSLVRVRLQTQAQILVAGIFAGVTHDYFLLSAQGNLLEMLAILDALNYALMVTTILTWCLFTTIIFFLISNVLIFAELARDSIRVDLLDSSSLRPFSRVAVYSTLILLGALASFPLLLVDGQNGYLTILPGLLATFFPMVFIFLIPIVPISQRIRASKSRELALIQLQISRLVAGNNSLPEDREKLSELQPLLDYRREVKQVPEWPFDSLVIFRLLFYLTIPPLTWVGAALIERLVDTVHL
jgi:hypothetical protein